MKPCMFCWSYLHTPASWLLKIKLGGICWSAPVMFYASLCVLFGHVNFTSLFPSVHPPSLFLSLSLSLVIVIP